MSIRPSAKRPTILAIRFLDRKIIDACEPQTHQAIIIELPILVAVRAIPISRVVVPLIREAHSNAIAGKGPKLFYKPVIQLFRPLASEEGDDVVSSVHKLGAVSPSRIK